MFSKAQLEFLQASLTQPGAAVPCANGGATARLFVSVLDEVTRQLEEIDTAERAAAAKTLASSGAGASGNGDAA